MGTIRLILGDQLNIKHSWFNEVNNDTYFVMMEIKAESEYVTHHIQKIVGIFAAMRQFSDQLKENGHHIKYWKISDEDNKQSFQENIKTIANEFGCDILEVQEPDEYRLQTLLDDLGKSFEKYECVSSEHFYTNRDYLKEFFEGKKTYLMENFYRSLRERENVLMQEGKPEGGKWNFDKDNRNKLPKNHRPPEPNIANHDFSEIFFQIKEANLNFIGNIDATHFLWPVTRDENLTHFDYFLTHLFEYFGTYQDSLSNDYWSVYHSRISFGLNLKLISPEEIVTKAESCWSENKEKISLSQCEGFIRQILGWREFMRGVYWAQMPAFAEMNFFSNESKLPKFYWTGETKMNCLKTAIKQSLQFGYAHHIQRLMVTGNFALLAGVHPDEIDEWYLGIYVDAFEWVEITNTRGMSQFADGGLIATKPYISSGSYINKMGDHCKTCFYSHTKKTGDKSCPFNSLYWNFIDKNKALLQDNFRMKMMYSVWDKMDKDQQTEYLQQAETYLNMIDIL